MAALSTAVNQRLAEREQAAEQQRIHEAKKSLAHQLQASTLPGGSAMGDPLQVFRRHDKEGKEGLSLEQFSAAIRRDGKLDRSKLSEKEVSQLFASLDTEKQGVVKLDKLSSLTGSRQQPARKPLGEVPVNGTPTPRDRQGRGKKVRSSTRARLTNPSRGATDSADSADAEAMLAAAEATVIAREQHSDETVPLLSLLPNRRSISCIPRKPRPPGTTSREAASLKEPMPSVERTAEANEIPQVSPVDDESPCEDIHTAAEGIAVQGRPKNAVSGPEWSPAEHSRFAKALEMQSMSNSPPAEAWAAISAQVGGERTVAEVRAYGMRYLTQLSDASEQSDSNADPGLRKEGLSAGPAHPKPEQIIPHERVDSGGSSGSHVPPGDSGLWTQEERGRLAAALDILGPALLSPGSVQPSQAVRVWDSLANAVGGGRTPWETRLFAAEWLVRGGGADQAAGASTLSAIKSQQEQLTEQTELIQELVAEHAACEAERREAVQKWSEKEALIAEIVEEHAGVEAERREAVIRAEDAESELADAHRAARIVAIDVIARNLAATAIQAQWRKWSAARLLKREIRNAVVFARQHWRKKEIDHRAAAQLARVVVSAEASHASLSNALLEAHTELRPLREAVVNAAARLRAEQEQHGMTKAALRHATTRAQVLEQRLYELSQTLSGE